MNAKKEKNKKIHLHGDGRKPKSPAPETVHPDLRMGKNNIHKKNQIRSDFFLLFKNYFKIKSSKFLRILFLGSSSG